MRPKKPALSQSLQKCALIPPFRQIPHWPITVLRSYSDFTRWGITQVRTIKVRTGIQTQVFKSRVDEKGGKWKQEVNCRKQKETRLPK